MCTIGIEYLYYILLLFFLEYLYFINADRISERLVTSPRTHSWEVWPSWDSKPDSSESCLGMFKHYALRPLKFLSCLSLHKIRSCFINEKNPFWTTELRFIKKLLCARHSTLSPLRDLIHSWGLEREETWLGSQLGPDLRSLGRLALGDT